VRQAAHPHADLHTKLLANCLAQSQALMLGKTAAVAATESAPTAAPGLDRAVLARHRSFPGNRPSTTFVLDALTPRSLGALIALYEHRVFTSGALWGINSFDQWGVELGKALCNQLLPRFASGDAGAGRVHRRSAEDAARMTKAVVFDFGAVLFQWQPLQLLQQCLRVPELAPDEGSARRVAAQIFESFTPDSDWARFDLGRIAEAELADRIAARIGVRPSRCAA
jgi:hypothetical protein